MDQKPTPSRWFRPVIRERDTELQTIQKPEDQRLSDAVGIKPDSELYICAVGTGRWGIYTCEFEDYDTFEGVVIN